MAKRRASESNGDVSKKPKEEDSDSEGEAGNPEETITEEMNINYEPDQMRILVDSFNEFCESNESATVKSLEKLVTEWAEKRKAENDSYIDITMFCQDYRRYLKTAMKVSIMGINDSSRITLRYLQDEKALVNFKDFPQKPPQVIQIYIKRNNLSKQLHELASAYEAFKNESKEVVEEVQEIHKQQEREYAQALLNFLTIHPHLTTNQITSIDSRAKSILKRIDKPSGARRSNATGKKKDPETAFSLWARTKADKYRDLSDEERDAKLHKKFAKLSSSELKLLEELAMASG
ncbi:unnamed protein product [Caenorhabditis angaria]|uniref:Uncharacterized protein n=1 Tax=Caenorhabditis angaria TaxID=860376 RepID=A0A9P1N4I6_9PELO|nr:unnamed protein product [Caenorhabditis angaria]